MERGLDVSWYSWKSFKCSVGKAVWSWVPCWSRQAISEWWNTYSKKKKTGFAWSLDLKVRVLELRRNGLFVDSGFPCQEPIAKE